jgi:6-phosphogluconolactonase
LVSQVVYVTNADSNNVSAYTIDAADGALTAVLGSPFAAGSGPSAVAVHPSGRFVYVVNSDNTISAYTVNPGSGALSAVPGSPFRSVSQSFAGAVAVDPTGKFAYVTNGPSNSVSAYTINTVNGALTAVPGSPFSTTFPSIVSEAVAVHPSGKFIYLAGPRTGNNFSVSVYTIDTGSGALKAVPGSPFPTAQEPVYLTLDPAGKFLYVDTQFGQNNFSAYAINTTSGGLTAIPGLPLDTGFTQGMAIGLRGQVLLPDDSLA